MPLPWAFWVTMASSREDDLLKASGPGSAGRAVLLFGDVDCLAFHTRADGNALRLSVAGVTHQRIPVVYSSSRTRAEIEQVRQELGLTDPFISENGSAVFIPGEYFPFAVPGARQVAGYEAVEFGMPHGSVVEMLRRVATQSGVRVVGFSDMSVEEVAAECGVPLLRARLAKLREYSEPIRIVAADSRTRSDFFKGLQAAHLACSRHGRYEHVGGSTDASWGIELLKRLYRKVVGPVITVGLGDAVRDASLLRSVDVPVVIREAASSSAADNKSS